MSFEAITTLIADLRKGDGYDKALDVRVEVALFTSVAYYRNCRSNDAGTKVIYTDRTGKDITYRASEWTRNRQDAINLLMEIAQ